MIRRHATQRPRPATTPDRPDDWRNAAACRLEGAELFFPVGTTGAALAQIEEAKAICRACPVILRCAKWALETRQEHGVWGGLSEDERRSILRRQARQRTSAA